MISFWLMNLSATLLIFPDMNSRSMPTLLSGLTKMAVRLFECEILILCVFPLTNGLFFGGFQVSAKELPFIDEPVSVVVDPIAPLTVCE